MEGPMSRYSFPDNLAAGARDEEIAEEVQYLCIDLISEEQD